MRQEDECARKADMAKLAGVVEPQRVHVWEDAFHTLYVSVDGKEFSNVRAVRAFPLSGKADYVSFLDENNREVALVAHPHKLDKDSRRTLEEALERMYYVAKIKRIEKITEEMGVAHWQVLTDRGYAAFEVVDRQNIRRLGEGRYLIVDADGNRFEIEDISKLDPRSQLLVQSEI